MKHQIYPRSTKPTFQDPKLDDGEHKKVASIRKHHPACEPVQKKPLAGRIFYLDLPCNKRSQALETDIKSLGGTVEKFFSKEIRYLVSNKPEARHVRRLIHDSPVPSPDSGLSSPHPGSRRDSHGPRGSSQGPADTVFVSRGKSLVEKVVKEQERFQMNRILTNALEWGVKILHIDDVISYIDKKKSTIAKVRAATHSVKKAAKPEHTGGTASQKSKAGRMSRPFVKVEDSSRHYRPLYLHMANMPVCNLRSAAPCSPFLEENDKDEPGKKSKVHGSGGDRREKSRKDRHRGREGKGRRKGGYCECCIVKYDNLKAHLQSEQHQTFSTSEEYLVVDRVISGLTCDFVHISPQMKRVKCSVTSPLIVPGPVVRKDRETCVEEDVTDETPLWSSHNTERSARKRSRELSHSPKGNLAGQSVAFQKSQSKRGSFKFESSSNAALQKDLGTPLCNTRQECLSERLERTRTSSHTLSERRTSQSRLSVRLSDPAGFSVTRSSLGAGTSHVVSEPSAVSDIQTVPKLLLDVRERTTEIPDCNTSKTPDVAHHRLGTETFSSSDTGVPSGVLKRKVRAWRRKRNTPSESMGWISVDFPVESQTLQGLEEDSKSHRLSASALDLGQLFQSSDDTEEDFKGFLN